MAFLAGAIGFSLTVSGPLVSSRRDAVTDVTGHTDHDLGLIGIGTEAHPLKQVYEDIKCLL